MDEYMLNKNFFENSIDIILMVAKDGRILYANKKAVDTYGYTHSELLNLSVFDLRNQDIKELTKSQLNSALNRGVQFKTYHYKKDGTKFPVDVRSVYNSEESRSMVVSIIRDITDFEEITKYANIMSASLDIFEDPIIVFTKDNKISYLSKGAEEKFGFIKNELIGKTDEELIPKAKINEAHDLYNDVKLGKVLKNYETIRLDKNEKIVDVSISASPIYDADGEISGIVAIYKDISDKKELIKKMLESEERWRYALEGGQFGVWDWSLDSNKIFCSNIFKIILGYDEVQLSHIIENWKRVVYPEDLEYVKDKINNHIFGEEYDMEFRMKCKEKNYKWVRLKGRVVDWTDSGTALRIIGTIEDISDKKVIQKELEEKYVQLELMKQEAENANGAKSIFLANMSHEIRTPMNGIITTIQLLQSESLSDEQKKYAKILNESAGILLGIINNLLDISKIESGTFKLNMEAFDLKEIVNNIHNNLLVVGNSKGLEVSYYLDSNIDPYIIGDELRLKEIINNLISNAVKFTEEGYVSLRVKMLSSDEISERIEFRIKDSGIGIEESFKSKIFNNFSQGDLSTKKKYMGTGLGLAISKQLSDLMKGEIYFESTVGEGSTFFFICDFKKSNNKKTKKDIIEPNKIDLDKVILCVEDNLINQEAMESIIRKKGYKYLAAYNGREALEVLKNNKVDLILMDIQMPELNGIETTKIIREAEEPGKRIPIVAMTAYAMYENKEKCINANMDEHIIKPFYIDRLYEIIDSYLK